MLSPTLHLNQNNSASNASHFITDASSVATGQYGFSVTIADFNNDGYSGDVIVGSHYHNAPGPINRAGGIGVSLSTPCVPGANFTCQFEAKPYNLRLTPDPLPLGLQTPTGSVVGTVVANDTNPRDVLSFGINATATTCPVTLGPGNQILTSGPVDTTIFDGSCVIGLFVTDLNVPTPNLVTALVTVPVYAIRLVQHPLLAGIYPQNLGLDTTLGTLTLSPPLPTPSPPPTFTVLTNTCPSTAQDSQAATRLVTTGNLASPSGSCSLSVSTPQASSIITLSLASSQDAGTALGVTSESLDPTTGRVLLPSSTEVFSRLAVVAVTGTNGPLSSSPTYTYTLAPPPGTCPPIPGSNSSADLPFELLSSLSQASLVLSSTPVPNTVYLAPVSAVDDVSGIVICDSLGMEVGPSTAAAPAPILPPASVISGSDALALFMALYAAGVFFLTLGAVFVSCVLQKQSGTFWDD